MDNPQLPAYPIGPGCSLNYPNENGLTKLEVFTMAAMQGLCANPEAVKYFETSGVIQCTSDLPKAAANIAKSTLSELSKQQ
jgi:hypothetical protein